MAVQWNLQDSNTWPCDVDLCRWSRLLICLSLNSWSLSYRVASHLVPGIGILWSIGMPPDTFSYRSPVGYACFWHLPFLDGWRRRMLWSCLEQEMSALFLLSYNFLFPVGSRIDFCTSLHVAAFISLCTIVVVDLKLRILNRLPYIYIYRGVVTVLIIQCTLKCMWNVVAQNVLLSLQQNSIHSFSMWCCRCWSQ